MGVPRCCFPVMGVHYYSTFSGCSQAHALMEKRVLDCLPSLIQIQYVIFLLLRDDFERDFTLWFPLPTFRILQPPLQTALQLRSARHVSHHKVEPRRWGWPWFSGPCAICQTCAKNGEIHPMQHCPTMTVLHL